MFSRTEIFKSTKDCSAQIEQLGNALQNADSVVIGAGAGLSASAGYEYSGKRFHDNFADFEEKYGFHDMYEGGFYHFETDEEMWAFRSRNIMLNRYSPPPKPLYGELLTLVGGKDYFVLTTNVDHCFQRAGFDKKRLFYTQGDYGLFQCSVPCCGEPLTLNLRSDDSFVEDAGWHAAAERCSEFIRSRKSGRILYLELGVGYNTPSIIKYPFWKLTAENPKAVYASVNFGEAVCPEDIAAQAILINGDISEVLNCC